MPKYNNIMMSQSKDNNIQAENLLSGEEEKQRSISNVSKQILWGLTTLFKLTLL